MCLTLFGMTTLVMAQKPVESYPEKKSEALISNLTIPVQLDILTMQDIINTQMDSLIYEIKDLNNSSVSDFSMKVWRLDKIKLQGEKSSLFSFVPLRIHVKGTLKTKVLGLTLRKSIDQEMQLLTKFQTKIALNYNWDLISKTALVEYRWIKEPYIDFGPVKLPMGSIVDGLIDEQKDSINRTIDREIRQRFDLKKQIELSWKTFQLPFVASVWGEEKTWLYFLPSDEKVIIQNLHFEEDALKTQIRLQAFADAEFSKKLNLKPKMVPLPNLSYHDDLEPGVEMLVNAQVSKATALKKANELFLNKAYSFREGKYNVKILGINFYGSGQDIVIELDLSGSITGKVYLSGYPVYNASSNKMEIRNFAYILDAKTKISKFTRWLFAGKIKKQLKEGAEEVLNNQILEIRKQVEKGLENFEFSPQATLQGQVHQFYIKEIFLQPDTIFAKIVLNGDFMILLKGF
ncbi:MAG: DUF4403 family protein [Microscillaceae bacterium]|nr:DUF4403 family protein [Microscillaceae bacterium]